MRNISASTPTARRSKTRSGATRRHFRRWRKSPAIWPSIPIGSRSRSWLDVIASASEAIQGRKGRLDCFVACAPRNDGIWRASRLYPEDGKAEDQQDQEDHDEDIEQEAGDIRRCGRYAGEAENAGNDRDQEEQQRPSQNCHRPLLRPCDPLIKRCDPLRRVPCEIADLTFEQGDWFR